MSGIFIGNATKLFYNNDAGNNIPNAPTYVEIDELAEFPQVSIQTTTTQYETYDDEYAEVLSGNKSIQAVNIVVHYVPDNISHQYLDSMFTTQNKFQIKVSLYESSTSLDQHYVIINGYISSYTTSGDQNSVVNRTYVFTAEDVIAKGTAQDMPVLNVGDYGVGANGLDVPSYESATPAGNSFIKVPSDQALNPTGVDMLGIANVDGANTTKLVMTESGTLSLYATNQNSGWIQIQTKPQNDATYVPLTRTVNGKALSANIVLSSADTGSLALTGGTLTGALTGTTASFTGAVSTGALTASSLTLTTALSVANGGTGATTSADARTNLSVYSKSEMDSTVATLVPKTTTVNGHALSDNVTVTASDVGLGTVIDAPQLVAANNLSDVANVTTARTNILGAKSGANSDITSITGLTTALSIAQGGTGGTTAATARTNLELNNFRTFAGVDTRMTDPTGTSYVYVSNGGNNWGCYNTVTSATVPLSVTNGGTGNSTGLAASATILATARTVQTNLASTSSASFNGSANITPGVTGTLPIANGGTGATSATAAATALGLGATSVPYFSSIELSSATPFIDFHYGSTAADYNVRLINDANNLMSCSGVFDAAQGIASRAGLGGSRDSNVPFFFYWNYVTTSTGLYGFVGNTGLGNVSFVAASDKMLKTTPDYKTDNADVLDQVKQWKVASFKYKARGIIPESDEKLGFIANDLVLVSPEVVKGEGLPEDYDIETDFNNPNSYNLDQVALIAKLTQAIQQQQVMIEALQTQVDALTNK